MPGGRSTYHLATMASRLHGPSPAAASAILPRAQPLVLAGALALLLGVLVYQPLRTAWPAALPSWLIGSAPSLLHAFAFTLWTALALDARRAHLWGVALGWGLLETALEALQHPALHALLPAAWASRWGGTFDGFDIAASLQGCAAAAALVTWRARRSGEHP